MRRGYSIAAAVLLSAGAVCLGQTSLSGGPVTGQSIVGSPHDLSVTGPGEVHALYEEQVCIFCHAPHRATGQRPLWNRYMPPTHYRIYESSSTDARIDQPSGPSKMCLSCHDGALAIGLVASQPPNEPIVMSRRTIPPGPSNLQHDLSDDHPIGFRYDRALAARDTQIKNPDLLTPQLPLGKHGEVHCTTCHDAHNNQLGNFLRMSDVRSAICLSCHDMHGWELGSHARSSAAITGRAVDPREKLPYPTVADNACSTCHKIHSAGGRERLLRFRREEDNCLNCHNGSVARTNIAAELRKVSHHPIERYDNRHEPDENPRQMRRHVECADCHNPHAAAADVSDRAGQTIPGTVGPSMRYVSGLSSSGRPVEYARTEFEVCFKCHADGVSRDYIPDVPRQIVQTNTRMEFQQNNPSFHPVTGPRNNTDVVSLIPPWRVGSIVKCTDCHNSDQAGDSFPTAGRPLSRFARGPHGSIYEPLLIDNYSTDDFTTESARAYALCYRCHDRRSILSDESFPLHRVHIMDARASCAACHDAHGISRTQGSSRNHSNLINFDLSVVEPASGGLGGRIEYEDLGQYRGSCTLTCHGLTHVRLEYGR
jgi:predicted CXXCH cytochrome family protein